MNILIVSNFDPAGVGEKLRKCILKHTDNYCRHITLSKYPFEYERDIFINEVVDFEEIIKIVERTDVFQFIHCDWDDALDFGPIKWRDYIVGKKITVLILGEPFTLNYRKKSEKYYKYGAKVMPAWNRVADLLHHKTYEKIPPVIPDLMEERFYKDIFKEEKNNDKIKIFHAPTADIIKGTFLFEKVMQKIKKKFNNIEYLIVRGENHLSVIKKMWLSDIVFDEMWWEGTWGQTTLESASLGKPVLVYLSEDACRWYKEVYNCNALPQILINPDTLEEKLVELIKDREEIEKRGRKSREWFKKYVDSKETVEKIINFYQRLPVFSLNEKNN